MELALPVFNLGDSVASSLTFLNDQSGILSLSSILAAIGVFFYQQHNEKNKFNERIVKASNALITDLNQLEKSYSSGVFLKTTWVEKGIDFSNTSISVEYYQSVVSSGIITYYNEVTQIELSKLYYNMSLFTEWLKEFNHLGLYSSLAEPVRSNVMDKIAQKLTKHENEITTKIPVVRSLLEKEIKKLKKINEDV